MNDDRREPPRNIRWNAKRANCTKWTFAVGEATIAGETFLGAGDVLRGSTFTEGRPAESGNAVSTDGRPLYVFNFDLN